MKKSVIITLHILFWIALSASKIANPVLFKLDLFEHINTKFYLFVAYLPIVFFYGGYIGVMKINRKIRVGVILLLSLVTVYALLYFVSSKIFVYALIPIPSLFLWTTIGCLFRYFIDWFQQKNNVVILENENTNSKLALLKNQINPHFLFNTLHNIEALVHNSPDKASNSIITLSDMMRYMLKDTKADYVALKGELDHLENYLALEQIRLKNKNFLNYSVNGNPEGKKIAPMILIPFVENAFKHSVDSAIENGIQIDIRIEEDMLYFRCVNQFDSSENHKDQSHGIGLETVKNRLSLIYKNNYTLSINTGNALFSVDLKLKLYEN